MQNMEKKTNDQQFNINENATQIGKTQDTIYEHEATMDEIQQYIRRDCLEILGIPVLPDEKPNELITELAEQLGVYFFFGFVYECCSSFRKVRHSRLRGNFLKEP